jgi:hypothetical protein
MRWMIVDSTTTPSDSATTETDPPPTLVETGTDDCMVPAIQLTCGTGDEAFSELTDGATVVMVHGPQGGWHVWTGVAVEHSTQNVSLLPTITVPALGGLQLTSNPPPGDFVALAYEPETCSGSYYGQRAFIDTTAINANPEFGQQVICGLVGETLHLRLDLTDLKTGDTASCEVDVLAEPDIKDQALCASR